MNLRQNADPEIPLIATIYPTHHKTREEGVKRKELE
tara:strand:+ start:144 stop:251 length:108 start_codon:yes stop_codon:yes gene_type:complete